MQRTWRGCFLPDTRIPVRGVILSRCTHLPPRGDTSLLTDAKGDIDPWKMVAVGKC
uniref:Uncharacterized protein n=1 Tax=Chlorocebus sabaeus TaxID=60711 RepID=A0A0D9RRD9_CHLSB